MTTARMTVLTTLPDLTLCVSLRLLSICVLSCPFLYNEASLVAQMTTNLPVLC